MMKTKKFPEDVICVEIDRSGNSPDIGVRPYELYYALTPNGDHDEDDLEVLAAFYDTMRFLVQRLVSGHMVLADFPCKLMKKGKKRLFRPNRQPEYMLSDEGRRVMKHIGPMGAKIFHAIDAVPGRDGLDEQKLFLLAQELDDWIWHLLFQSDGDYWAYRCLHVYREIPLLQETNTQELIRLYRLRGCECMRIELSRTSSIELFFSPCLFDERILVRTLEEIVSLRAYKLCYFETKDETRTMYPVEKPQICENEKEKGL